ncbi:YciI family protein [Xanthobacter autotrophicus]|uniref:YciI family protein n=1 Tax=Xanthobacter autotrophicus TaxID=280 RepID=UPI001E4019C4|nr:YciI family protein [Xanthobacter autotrophicus]UDQ89620.1 YciI family protein [Xanthobacter autotrophicus]
MPHFLLRLSPPRPSFPSDASAAEMEAMGAHFAFWQAEAEVGTALAVGPVADPAGIWGMAVIEVPDEAAATGLSLRDPVIKADLGFTYAVMPILSLIERRAPRPAQAEV